MKQRFWHTETAVFLGIWFVLITTGRSRLLRDPGTFWHTVVGQHFLAGEYPWTDPFSFTCAGQPWIAWWWLAECVMALLHEWAGWDGLVLATVTLLAGLYTWVAHRLMRAGLSGGLAILLTVLAMAASSYHFHARPHLATILLLGWTFARLCDFEAGRLPFRSLCWVVPVFAVWMNLHPGVVGGLATLALVIVGWSAAWSIDYLTGGNLRAVGSSILGPNSKPLLHHELLPAPNTIGRAASSATAGQVWQLLALGLLVIACGSTALLTPYGWEVPRTWFSALSSPVVARLIDEHRPLWESPECWSVFLLAGLYLAALVGVWPRWPRVTWLIPLVWFYLAWSRIRHGPLFAITAVVALADMWPHAAWVKFLSRRESSLFHLRTSEEELERRRGWRSLLIPAGLVLVAVGVQTLGLRVPVLGRGWAELDRTHWPVDLLPELRQYEHDHPAGTPIFNDMLFGGFLIYHTPGLRIFIDDRCELYGDERLQEYITAMNKGSPLIDHWAWQYGFEIALVVPASAFDAHFSRAAGWELQARSPAANLYRRK